MAAGSRELRKLEIEFVVGPDADSAHAALLGSELGVALEVLAHDGRDRGVAGGGVHAGLAVDLIRDGDGDVFHGFMAGTRGFAPEAMAGSGGMRSSSTEIMRRGGEIIGKRNGSGLMEFAGF